MQILVVKCTYNSKICTHYKMVSEFQITHKKYCRKGYVFCSIFLSIAKAMAYHHAFACISSSQAHIVNRRLYHFRNDDIQYSVLVIYNFCEMDDMQDFRFGFKKLKKIYFHQQFPFLFCCI